MSESVPFDLDAVERESSGELFKFTLGGEEYEMDSPEVADWRADLGSAEGMSRLLRGILGDKQYERFAQHEVPGYKMARLLEAAAKHYGINVGESSASTR